MGPQRADSSARHLRLVPGARDEEGAPFEGGSFDECFRQFHKLVATIGLRMLGRPGEVDDFVQDVFLEVHRSYATLRDPRAVKGWIRAIAVRVAVKRLRRRRLRAAVGLDQPVELSPLPVDGDQEQAAFVSEVYRALESVPAKARVIWVLRFVEGEKLQDIAGVMGIGLTTVKRQLALATSRLQEVFDA